MTAPSIVRVAVGPVSQLDPVHACLGALSLRILYAAQLIHAFPSHVETVAPALSRHLESHTIVRTTAKNASTYLNHDVL